MLTWTDKLENAEALLERGKEKKDKELMGKAYARIATAEEAIEQAKEDIKMYRESMRAGAATTASASPARLSPDTTVETMEDQYGS